MTKVFLYFTLFTYVIVMIKPVMPHIVDGAAHILFFKSHQENVHAHHGKMHAHVEVEKNMNNEHQGKHGHQTLKDNLIPDHIGFPESNTEVDYARQSSHLHSNSAHITSRFFAPTYPPPRPC